MTALDTLDPYASKEELDREDLLAIGRAHFDSGSTRITNPIMREHFAKAFAEISRPFGSRNGGSL